MKHPMLWALILSLILIPAVLAASGSKLHDAWHNSGDTFQINNDLYTLTLHPSYQSIRLELNNTLYLIPLDECAVSLYYKFCLVNISWDADKSTINSNGVTEPGFNLIVYSHEPEIKVIRTLVPSSLVFGDEPLIQVNITNIGDKTAESIEYRDHIPSTIKILNTPDLFQEGYDIVWKGLLYPNQDKVFSYKLKAINYVDETWKANTTYVYEGRKSFVESTALRFYVPKPFETKAKYSKSKPDIEDIFYYTYTINNKDTTDYLAYNVSFDVPLGLVVITHNYNLHKTGPTTYVLEGSLKPEQSKEVEFKLKSYYTGSYNISNKGFFRINDRNYAEEYGNVVDVQIKQVTPVITFNRYDIRAGEPFIMNVYFRNTDPDNEYFNINATVDGEFFKEHLAVPRLGIVDEYKFEKQYYPPLYNSSKTFIINVTGTYRSAANEQFSFYTQRQLRVGPVNQSFDVNQIISDQEVVKGENFTVEVKVKNLKDDTAYGILVFDEVPDGIELIQGTPRVSLDLIGKEQKQAYAYMLHVPKDYPESTLPITTTVSYEKGIQIYSRELSTTVKLLNATGQTAEEPDDETTEPPAPEPEPQPEPEPKEQGWFSKLISSIADFFSNLFGG